MSEQHPKLKRVLGFAPAYGASVGLVVSGTAMYSVGHVAGSTGYATFISALIAMIPMMVTAFAFGELAAMLPGGGMISDYTLPALGRFWGTFALLIGYVVLIATDGASQLILGGLSMEELAGIPQLPVTLVFFAVVLIVNILNVSFYGKIESFVTVTMMVIFAILAFSGVLGIGEAFGAKRVIQSTSGFLPEGGMSTVISATGAAVWFFIGFEFACPMAEENKKPYKNIPYALIIGLLTIFLLDSVFAVAAVRYTDMTVLRESTIPQTMAARAMLGNVGYILMTMLTIMASFTTANAYIASFPRMLYGLSREGMIPKIFARINRKTRTPIVGLIFTACIILGPVLAVTAHGADTAILDSLISTACITWMISYAIAMIDVLVLRKRYPDFPRLWKAPAARITMPIGLIGVIYAIYTLREYLLGAVICMAVIAGYCFIWCKIKNIDIHKPVDIAETVNNIRERSEYLAVWDEAVDEWCKKHA